MKQQLFLFVKFTLWCVHILIQFCQDFCSDITWSNIPCHKGDTNMCLQQNTESVVCCDTTLVWMKFLVCYLAESVGSQEHWLWDTARKSAELLHSLWVLSINFLAQNQNGVIPKKYLCDGAAHMHNFTSNPLCNSECIAHYQYYVQHSITWSWCK